MPFRLARGFPADLTLAARRLILLGVPIPLVLPAFCACYLPAHRAAQVDPLVALRHL